MSGMWKLSLDVEIEPAEINTAGSISTAVTLRRLIFHSRLNFHIPDIKKRDTISVWPKKKLIFR